MIAMQRHFSAACSPGKRPRALTARRVLALTDASAWVVRTTRRMSVSKRRNGMNSSHALATVAEGAVDRGHGGLRARWTGADAEGAAPAAAVG